MLASQYRFHGRRSLSLLFRQGRVVRARSLALRFFYNKRRTDSRLAVVVGRKVSKSAPVRNRIRRRIYEIVRKDWENIRPQYDMAIFVYDKEVATLPHAELEATITQLLTDADIYNDTIRQ